MESQNPDNSLRAPRFAMTMHRINVLTDIQQLEDDTRSEIRRSASMTYLLFSPSTKSSILALMSTMIAPANDIYVI